MLIRKVLGKIKRKVYLPAEKKLSRVLGYVSKRKKIESYDIPIIINNRNRLNYLKKLISSLESRGYNNINIIDNDSTYPPLLEFYKKTRFNILYLNKNLGYLALWKSGIYKKYINNYYVYTDPDVLPIDECPDNFMEFFLENLLKIDKIDKIGFSLKIDDIPDCFKKKRSVIEWESRFYNEKINGNLFKAPIDTTFALYRPWIWGGFNPAHFVVRTGYPYVARHLPWYEDSENLSEESLFYVKNSTKSTHWTELSKKH